ncbi:hypothetical protein [Bartonella sp. HY406]|uniref:hypothetical protein n=1 Tax=Bartonella sp. HY406 TaxID=2979331 RepID=UPI0021C79E76|nr:hypothetical protein [Bartonella sp. HY406]UXN04675.1 hypothetical protein N6B01_06630 [Bartonella sp. HY406]
MSDYKGVALLLLILPDAQELIADKGINSDWFRQALLARKSSPASFPEKVE